ncbi:hypothetical protein MA04_02864 [Alcanivorax balearicus MACL04]|nr:hypothetical protein P40_06875 [Alloalcanivorax xenomutans]KYZ87205.1 hypothetical protein A3Q32_13500 [Alcanivorax sp. KX64203]MCU5783564.1 hypothetical protein [Alloalcanivorax balearicus MACL04]PHS60150.1 MAG: hypothetical protein COB00_16595 [Alcanivorax sp.]CUR48157.1 hypothetical protein BN2364_3716 [Alloalcanivorax xenomutans]
MEPDDRNSSRYAPSPLIRATMSASALFLTIWISPALAEAIPSRDGCVTSTIPHISPELARQAGMTRLPNGQYELDMAALAARAGGPAALLRVSRRQYEANMAWLSEMASLVADPGTPLLPQVQSVYRQGWETNVVEMSIIQAMECQLGLAPSDLERPAPPSEAIAERQKRIAQGRAEAEAEARKAARWSTFSDIMIGVSNAVGTAAGAMSGSGGGGSPSGSGTCPGGTPRDSAGKCEVGYSN